MTANTCEAKADSRVQRVLRTREDVFRDYTEQSFLDAFEENSAVEGSGGIAWSGENCVSVAKEG